jgi:type I restriction enzyme S subunit
MMKKAFSILGDFCDVTDCEHKTAPTIDQGYPLIRTPNIGRGTLILDNVYRVSNETYAAWTRRRRPEPGDLIMAREAPVGNVAIIPAGLSVALGQRTVLLRVTRTKELDPAYLNYLLNSDGVHTYLNALSNGATVGHLNVGDIRKLRLPEFPPIQLQRKIASILSAYDDLIENNKRRIAILEKMAEEIYREWFVRMRFSSYAKATADKPATSIDSNFWTPGQRVPINRLVKFLSGYSFKSQDYSPTGRFGIVTIKNVHDGLYVPECSDRIDEPPSNMKKYCHLRDGDILMSLTGNVGRVCRVHGTGNLLNQRVAKLAPVIEGTEDFVYWFFRNSSIQTLCELISTGAAQQNLSPIKLGNQLVPLPSVVQMKHFCSVVKSATEQISNLLKQNQNLTLSRDLLLPRLISGKLSVENLDLPSSEKLASVSSALPQQELAHA